MRREAKVESRTVARFTYALVHRRHTVKRGYLGERVKRREKGVRGEQGRSREDTRRTARCRAPLFAPLCASLRLFAPLVGVIAITRGGRVEFIFVSAFLAGASTCSSGSVCDLYFALCSDDKCFLRVVLPASLRSRLLLVRRKIGTRAACLRSSSSNYLGKRRRSRPTRDFMDSVDECSANTRNRRATYLVSLDNSPSARLSEYLDEMRDAGERPELLETFSKQLERFFLFYQNRRGFRESTLSEEGGKAERLSFARELVRVGTTLNRNVRYETSETKSLDSFSAGEID